MIHLHARGIRRVYNRFRRGRSGIRHLLCMYLRTTPIRSPRAFVACLLSSVIALSCGERKPEQAQRTEPAPRNSPTLPPREPPLPDLRPIIVAFGDSLTA